MVSVWRWGNKDEMQTLINHMLFSVPVRECLLRPIDMLHEICSAAATELRFPDNLSSFCFDLRCSMQAMCHVTLCLTLLRVNTSSLIEFVIYVTNTTLVKDIH